MDRVRSGKKKKREDLRFFLIDGLLSERLAG